MSPDLLEIRRVRAHIDTQLARRVPGRPLARPGQVGMIPVVLPTLLSAAPVLLVSAPSQE